MHANAQPTPRNRSRQSDTGGEPRPGDLVVFCDARSAARHAVAEFPGDAQYTAASHQEALRLAGGYARAHRVDVWYRQSQHYERVESYRLDPGGDTGGHGPSAADDGRPVTR